MPAFRAAFTVGLALTLATSAPSLAVPGGKAETGAEFRSVYQVKVPTPLGPSSCSGVAIRPRVIMTAAHCVLLGFDNDRARIASTVEVQEGDGMPVIAKATSVRVSATFERLVRERGGYSHVEVRNFRTFSSDLAGLSDHAFVILDRPVPHSASLLDMVDGKAMDARGEKDGVVSAEDVRAYVRLLIERFYGGNDVDPVFVGFGNTRCQGKGQTDCSGKGIRRSAHLKATFGKGCKSQMYTFSYFCVPKDAVLPGDSGGALFLKAKDGKRYPVGILSGADGEGFIPTMLMAARLFSRLDKQ